MRAIHLASLDSQALVSLSFSLVAPSWIPLVYILQKDNAATINKASWCTITGNLWLLGFLKITRNKFILSWRMFSPRSKSYKEQTYFPYGLNLSPGPGWQLTAFNFIYWFISPEQANIMPLQTQKKIDARYWRQAICTVLSSAFLS